MVAFYNEHDPFAAAWLRELIAQGEIAPGVVDERSILDVRPADLVGFDQCHFFAGIGGWSLALRLAGWPDSRPVWTGSCPCQPFSSAGRGEGLNDERHLWPVFAKLIRARRPGVVLGEQVTSSAVVGGAGKPSRKRARKHDEPAWIDLVFADLEAARYSCGAADIPAAGVGAPHRRQRLWWVGVADADHDGQPAVAEPRLHDTAYHAEPCRGADNMADTGRPGLPARECDELRGARGRGEGRAAQQCGGASDCVLGDAEGVGRDSGAGQGPEGHGQAAIGRGDASASPGIGDNSRHLGPWSDLVWLPCRDGKARPTQSRFQPVADGVWPSMVGSGLPYLHPLAPAKTTRNRVGTLRGAGNAIVPQAGAAWVEVVMETLQ